MRILLVGEYSRLHNSLKEGLTALGHEVCLISTGDYFKKFPADILLKRKFNQGISKKAKVGFYKVFKKDFTSLNILKQFFSYKEELKNFDVVQLINETPLGIQPEEEKKAVDFLKKHNENIFLLSCGTDVSSVSFALKNKLKYSIFTPLQEKKVSEEKYSAALKYTQPEFKKHHHYLYDNIIKGVIASDMDYHIPLKNNPKYLGLIENPVNVEKIKFSSFQQTEKICIFLGINRSNYFLKGIDFFEKALAEIQLKYPTKVEIIKAENLPYQEYIKSYEKADILLDQVYSFDQGYNALEAMAAGKVVFTGAEKEFLKYYDLQENQICINALSDMDDLIEKLAELIENPEKIRKISSQARKFVEEKHHYIQVAQKYLKAWKAT